MSNFADQVPEIDREYLEDNGFKWKALPGPSGVHVVIDGYKLPPEHYAPAEVELLLQLPAGYPNAAPDMFWINPEVKKIDGSAPVATEVRQEFHGKTWQRWSRHHGSPWRSGIDSLRTFLSAIRQELKTGR